MVRSQTLYPTELRARACDDLCGAMRLVIRPTVSAYHSNDATRRLPSRIGQRVENNSGRIECLALTAAVLQTRKQLIERLARAAVRRIARPTAAGMMVVMMMTARRLRQVLDIGQLPAGRGVREVG